MKEESKGEAGDDDLLWNQEGDSGVSLSRNKKKFRNFSDRSIVRVKPVVLPQGGQSYNPSGPDHQKTLTKVA